MVPAIFIFLVLEATFAQVSNVSQFEEMKAQIETQINTWKDTLFADVERLQQEASNLQHNVQESNVAKVVMDAKDSMMGWIAKHPNLVDFCFAVGHTFLPFPSFF